MWATITCKSYKANSQFDTARPMAAEDRPVPNEQAKSRNPKLGISPGSYHHATKFNQRKRNGHFDRL